MVKSNNEENGQTEIEMCGYVAQDKSADKSKESEKYAAATATSKTVSYGYMVGITEC